ncbi:MAG: hypothetical protein KAY37_12040 [Phycisphaerae bacterium]|nr:hypothetical protein [Phycisphaerae bacterium]
MPEDQVSPLTGKPYPTISTPLRELLGPSLPVAANIDELCSLTGSVPVLLEEIIYGMKALIDPKLTNGEKRLLEVDVRAVAFRLIVELQEWLPNVARNVLAKLDHHPQFDKVFHAVEEVRICADVLCKLTYDRVRTPEDQAVVARCVKVETLVQGAINDLRPLAYCDVSPPDSTRLFSDPVCKAFDDVTDEAAGDTDYLRQLASMLRYKIEKVHASQAGDSSHRNVPGQSITKRQGRIQWLAEAMLLVQDHPDWSDAEIARHVGKDRSTLSRSKEYRASAAMARGKKADLPSGHIKNDPDTGLTDVEAYDEKDDYDDA